METQEAIQKVQNAKKDFMFCAKNDLPTGICRRLSIQSSHVNERRELLDLMWKATPFYIKAKLFFFRSAAEEHYYWPTTRRYVPKRLKIFNKMIAMLELKKQRQQQNHVGNRG